MSTIKITGLFLALAIIAALGCSKPEDKFVGHYSGTIQLAQKFQDQLANLPPAVAAKAKSQMDQMKFDLELSKDKTYTVTGTMPMQGPLAETGTWVLADKAITLSEKTETVNGKPVPNPDTKPKNLTFGSDPKVLT